MTSSDDNNNDRPGTADSRDIVGPTDSTPSARLPFPVVGIGASAGGIQALVTSKEELQSVNEELLTVNTQLQAKIAQLEVTTNDLANLLSSTDIAVVFLDAEFRVRRFTPAVNDLLELRESDLGRPITDLAQKFTDDKMLSDARAVLQKLVPVEREVRSDSGRWYLRRTLPYRTSENHIEGVVVTFVDIAARKRAEDEILSSQKRLQAVLDQMPTAVVMVMAPGGRLLFANNQAATLFKHTFPIPVPGDPAPPFFPVLSGRHAGGEFYRAQDWPLARALVNDQVITDGEITVHVPDGREMSLLVSAAPVRDHFGHTVAVVGTFLDITERKKEERQLLQVEARFRLLVESAKDFAIFYVDTKGRVITWNSGAERILGWSEAEMVGQPAAVLFTPEDRAALVPEGELRQAEKTGRANDERWHVRKDGSRFWASGVMAAVPGARLGNLRRAAIRVRGHGLLERGQIDAGHAVHIARLDRRWHAQVHHHQRARGARCRRGLEIGAGHQVRGGVHGAEDRVGGRQQCRQRLEPGGLAAHRGRNRLGALAAAVGHHQVAHAEPAEVTGHLHAGGAGADDDDTAVGQRRVLAPPVAPPPRPPTARQHRARSRRESARRRAAPPAPRRAGSRRRRARSRARRAPGRGSRPRRAPGTRGPRRRGAGGWQRRCRTGSRSSAADRPRLARTSG